MLIYMEVRGVAKEFKANLSPSAARTSQYISQILEIAIYGST